MLADEQVVVVDFGPVDEWMDDRRRANGFEGRFSAEEAFSGHVIRLTTMPDVARSFYH